MISKHSTLSASARSGSLRTLPVALLAIATALVVSSPLRAEQAPAMQAPVAQAPGFVITDVRLQGLQRVSAGTVFNLIPVAVGDRIENGAC